MKNKSLLHRIFFILSLALIFSSGHIENPDTHLRLTQARFLVEKGTFEIEHGFGEVSHGNLAQNSEGRQYSVYNPGQILLFVPIYYITQFLVSDQIDTYYTAAFIASFLGYLIYGLIIILFWEFGKALLISERKRILITLIFALTSYCFAHAQDSYEHIYEAFFLLLSVWLIYKNELSRKWLILAAISLGLGLLFRTSIAIAIPGILWLIPSWRQRISFMAYLLPFFIILLYYNYARFNDPFENGYAIAWLRAFGQTPQTSFNLFYIPKHTFGLLLSFGKGLLLFSPSLLLILLSLKNFWKKQRSLFISTTLITAAYVGLYATNFAWHGSAWNWGPRYIIPIVPLLYLSLFYISESYKKLTITLAIISFIVQILAITTFYKRELVETLVEKGDIFWSDEYFFSPTYSPIKGQLESFIEVTQSMLSGTPKELFLPKGPWRNESRPASQEDMLAKSIDLNVYNFWWVRNLYISDNWALRLIGIFLVSLALLALTVKFRSLWLLSIRQ